MDIQGDSIVDSIIEYANVKFGVELSVENVSKQLKKLSLGKTLDIVDAIKYEDNDLFLDYVDITEEQSYNEDQSVEEAYGTIGTQGPVSSTEKNKEKKANVAARRASLPGRSGSNGRVAAGGINTTSTGARSPKDDDREEREMNAARTNSNRSEIENLKRLVGKMTGGQK